MIPKIIHYCWFGGNQLPELAVKCIDSWKIFFPDYEIKEWNESNFDVNSIPYTRDAYKAKKYAFVSDYARFYILYNLGGLYFDTDVEVIKDMTTIIGKGPFMGCENEPNEKLPNLDYASGLGVNPGLGIGAEPGLSFYKEVLDYYSTISFINSNGSYNQTTVVEHITALLLKHGLSICESVQECGGIYIYPKEYFCPLDYHNGELNITENTYTIHHYMASWHQKKHILFRYVSNIIGIKMAHKIANLLKNLHIVK